MIIPPAWKRNIELSFIPGLILCAIVMNPLPSDLTIRGVFTHHQHIKFTLNSTGYLNYYISEKGLILGSLPRIADLKLADYTPALYQSLLFSLMQSYLFMYS